jgi:TolB-like protein/DNA-binding winged helix-turn-helix (wHTH) protein/Tfp pilus assembly protein PilF
MAVGDGSVDGDFRIGEWLVSPALNQIAASGTTTRVEPKAMQVLVYLAEHPGVVSKEQLISSVWPGVFVSEDVLPGCISALRKAFNDNARRPRVIETIHKSGYHLILRVEPASSSDQIADTPAAVRPRTRTQFGVLAIVLATTVLVLAAFVWLPSRRHYESVAVLPFLNNTQDPGAKYLSNGIAEQVVDDLSQLNAVKVMAWTTVSRYQQPQGDIRAIGRDLGVKAILTGQLVREGNRVALQTELVDVSNGSQLWGQRYERSVSDISTLQQQLSRDIADNLRVRLTGDEEHRIQHHQQPPPAAYELYLKGRFFWGKRTKDGMYQAIQYLQQAIDIDPNYALAWAGLADCYNLLDDWGKAPPRDSFPKARVAAEKAIALDDSLAEAHVSLAMVRGSYDWDWVGSEQEFKRAIELNPNYATAHQWYGETLASLGRFAEAEKEVRRGQELDPLSPIANMAVAEVYSWERRDDEAIAQYKKAIDLDPAFAGAYGNLAASYQWTHRYAEAVEAMKREETLDGDAEFAAVLDRAYGRGGFHAVIEEELKSALEDRKKKYVNPVGIADIYAELGDVPHAVEWLEKGYEAHASGMQYLAISRGFDPIRSDPEFRYWLTVLNLPTLTTPARETHALKIAEK